MTENTDQPINSAEALRQLSEKIKLESIIIQKLREEVAKIIVGQDYMIDRLLIALLADGHVLLEGVPGLAKTLAIKTLAQAIDLDFSRIQFTPDLLPADVTGTMIYQQKSEKFTVKKGPVFANFVLADEINRAPAKVQSALLEAMQEKQITIGEETFQLPLPFLVLATQNPIEQEGTYPLPEAQVDRFMFKLLVQYPSKEQEREILHKKIDVADIRSVLSKKDIFAAQALVKQVYVDDRIKSYIVDLVFATRDPKAYNLKDLVPLIQYGVSPRATLALQYAAQAYAFLRGRHFVIPDDIKAVAPAILRHRLLLSYQAEAEEISPDTVIRKILSTVPAP
jgi:MoxR-like ATPase